MIIPLGGRVEVFNVFVIYSKNIFKFSLNKKKKKIMLLLLKENSSGWFFRDIIKSKLSAVSIVVKRVVTCSPSWSHLR